MGFLDFLKKGLTPEGKKLIPFIKAAPTLLKKKAEEITILPFLPKARVPLEVKATLATAALFPTRALTLVRAVPKAILPITFKKAAIAATGIGILQVSPKAREFVLSKIRDPTGTGRAIGEIIEDPSILQPDVGKTTLEKVKEVGKAAGIVGGVAAAGAAIVAAVKKRREAPIVPETFAAMPALPSFEPVGVVKKAVEPVPVAVKPIPDIINKISVKPEINVRVSQTRKFINQQILMR